MRTLIAILIVCLCCSVTRVMAQEVDSLGVGAQAPVVKLDSLTMGYIDAIFKELIEDKPRYKMYPTQNIHILLKLDTATGRVWMVQYGTGKEIGFSVPVDDTSLLYSWDTIRAGRFELYPTQNMYNFILLDTQMGFTYQIQWHVDPDSRMRVRIF